MSKKDAAPKGKKFAALLAIHWKGSLSSFVREVAGDDIAPEWASQNGGHWKKRGVPAKYAMKAAQLLKCEPADISDLEQGESQTASPDLPKMHAALFDDIKDFDDAKMVAMIKAAGWVAMGLPIAPAMNLQKQSDAGASAPLQVDKHTVVNEAHRENPGDQIPSDTEVKKQNIGIK